MALHKLRLRFGRYRSRKNTNGPASSRTGTVPC